MKIPILFEDKDVLVLNKPAGLMVHGDGRTKEKTVVDFILKNYPEIADVGEPTVLSTGEVVPRPGIVHRLDKETSGVLVVAKNEKTFQFLKKQFQERTLNKTYLAIVWGHIKEDTGSIDKSIGRSPSDFRRWLAGRGARGELREAVTDYKVLKRFDDGANKFSLVEVRPKTGRTHQIRVHFKFLNHPIVCDSLYAPNNECPVLGMSRLGLHALSIEFTLPSKNKIKVEAPIPTDFKKAIQG